MLCGADDSFHKLEKMKLRPKSKLKDLFLKSRGRPTSVDGRCDARTQHSSKGERLLLHGETDSGQYDDLNHSDSGTQQKDVSSKFSIMDTTVQTSKPVGEYLGKTYKEPMGQHPRNADAFTQYEVIPTTVKDGRRSPSASAEPIDSHDSGCMKCVLRRPGGETAQSEQTTPDFQQWHSNTPGPPSLSYPLMRYLNSTSESGAIEDLRRSSLNDIAFDDEHTTGASDILHDGLAQLEYEEDDTKFNCDTDNALDALHLSDIPPAEEYWVWDKNAQKYYHRDEDTQSLTWYGTLD